MIRLKHSLSRRKPSAHIDVVGDYDKMMDTLFAGELSGQNGFEKYGTPTSTVNSTGVSLITTPAWQTGHGVRCPRRFDTGVIRVLISKDNRLFMMGYCAGATDATRDNHFSLWSTDSTHASMGVRNSGVTTSFGNFPNEGDFWSEDRWFEIRYNGQQAGKKIEFRSWKATTGTRPLTADLIYTFTGTEPATTGDYIVFKSMNATDAAGFKKLEIRDETNVLKDSILFTGNWFRFVRDGKPYMTTINNGNYLEFTISNTTEIILALNIATANGPEISYSLNGAAYARATKPNFQGVGFYTLASGLNPATTYNVKIALSLLDTGSSIWSLGYGLHISGIKGSTGFLITKPTDNRDVLFVFGGSIVAGNGITSDNSLGGEYSFSHLLGDALNMRTVARGFAGTGITQIGSASVPKATDNIFSYMSTIKMYNELVPKKVLIYHGNNDGSADDATFNTHYYSLIDQIRIRWPFAEIHLLSPVAGTKQAQIQAVAAAKGPNYINPAAWANQITTTDGLHPNVNGHVKMKDNTQPVLVIPMPNAPTNPVTDDTADTFNWTNNAAYTALADYQLTLDGGTTWNTVTAKPSAIGGAVNKAAGQVGVRVKAVAGVSHASLPLFNLVAFSAPLAPAETPTNFVVDDINKAFSFTYSTGITTPSAYEYNVKSRGWVGGTANPQPLYNELYAVGEVQVRVKATQSALASGILSNASAYTSAQDATIGIELNFPFYQIDPLTKKWTNLTSGATWFDHARTSTNGYLAANQSGRLLYGLNPQNTGGYKLQFSKVSTSADNASMDYGLSNDVAGSNHYNQLYVNNVLSQNQLSTYRPYWALHRRVGGDIYWQYSMDGTTWVDHQFINNYTGELFVMLRMGKFHSSIRPRLQILS